MLNTRITKKHWYHIYQSIPLFKHQEFMEFTGLKKVSKIFNSRGISMNNHDLLLKYVEHMNNDKFTSIGKPAEYDHEQIKHFYKELNKLIDTPIDYRVLDCGKKDRIIFEQNRLSKQIKSNSPF